MYLWDALWIYMLYYQPMRRINNPEDIVKTYSIYNYSIGFFINPKDVLSYHFIERPVNLHDVFLMQMFT